MEDWLTIGDLKAMADEAADAYDLPRAGFRALVQQESGWDPDVTSSAGAVGLTQLMPGTAADLGVTDRTDPAESLLGGARYLRMLIDRYGGDPRPAIAAYNWGLGNIDRVRRDWGTSWSSHLPEETTKYLAIIGPSFPITTPSRTSGGLVALVLALLAAAAWS